jgi:hypothetical protein
MGAALVAAVVVLIAVAIAPLLGKPARATIFFIATLFIVDLGLGAAERPELSGPTARETVGIGGSTDDDRPLPPRDAPKTSATSLPADSPYPDPGFNNRETMVEAMATLASSEFLCGKKLSSREWEEVGVFALIFGYRVHDARFRQDVVAKARETSYNQDAEDISSACSYAEVLKDTAHKVYIAAEETLSTLPRSPSSAR